MTKLTLAGMIPSTFTPPSPPWTERQQALAERLSQVIADLCLDPQYFTRSVLQSIDKLGNCQGLGIRNLVGEKDHTLLGHYLKSLGQLVVDENPYLSMSLPVLFLIIETWDSSLDRLRFTPDFEFLTEPPDFHNRTLYHQFCLLKTPAYHLVGAALHRGICAKIRQLSQRRDLKNIDEIIGEFATPSIRIARAIPEISIRGRLADYAPGEFDSMIFRVVQKMQKKIRVGAGRNYTGNTRRTLWSDWLAIFYASPDRKSYVDGVPGYSWRYPIFSPYSDTDFDLLPSTSPSRKLFLRLCEQQNRDEQVGLLGESERRNKKGELKASTHAMDGGHAVLAAQPTAAMPGVLAAAVLRLIAGNGVNLSGEKMEQAERAFVQLLIHTGRSTEWLLSLRLGGKPGSYWECEHPVIVPEERSIFFAPEIYPGLPESLWPSRKISWEEYSKKWTIHDRMYEPVDLVCQMPLPDPLVEVVSDVVTQRNQVLDGYPESAEKRGLSAHSGELWVFVSEGGIQSWNRNTLNDLFGRVNMIVQASIPKHSKIRAANFSRSFHGFYSDAGLRPEYRSYISGRLSYPVEMPLRYSRFNADQVMEAYSSACESVSRRIYNTESESVAPPPPPSLRSSFMGSWRVLRSDHIQQFVQALQSLLEDPDTLDGSLTLEQARHNSITLVAMFLLMLTSGLRPLEIPRIRPLHVDLLADRISIRGKARSIGQAYRWLPIFSGLKEYLKLLVTPDMPRQRKHFFYLYVRKDLEWPVSSVARLNRALGSVAEKAGFPTDLDLYGLRHRFRSDMLELNMPGHLLNYLMGHERPGDEAYNYYLERNLSELGPTFEEAAGKIAVKYGVLR